MSDTTTTSAKDWKKNGTGLGVIHVVQVPSGNTARLRRPGLDTFLRLGLIPNSLMSIISKNISEAKDNRAPSESELGEELSKLAQEPERLNDILQFADNVLIHCAVEPEVHPVPRTQSDRDEDKLYVDEVDLDDKMFIFGWAVGGSEDLATFREEQGRIMASLDSGPEARDQT